MAKYIRNEQSGKAALVENEVAFRKKWDAVYGARARYHCFETDEAEQATSVVEEATSVVEEASSVSEVDPAPVSKSTQKRKKYQGDKQRF